MLGTSKWSYDRYLPATTADGGIYICRVEPRRDSIEMEYKPALTGKLTFCRRGCDDRSEISVSGGRAVIGGLREDVEYEFSIACGTLKSDLRCARTGDYPDKVINYLHPEDGIYSFSGNYIGSPSVIRLPDGALVASHDVFRGGSGQNFTVVFRSDDNGASWYHTCDLFPCFWGKLFIHRGQLYMLAIGGEYGDVLIGKSEDGGRSFLAPTPIIRGSHCASVGGPHRAPMPILEDGGRLWTSLEFGTWNSSVLFNPGMISIDADADLLVAENWAIAPPLMGREGWMKELPAACIEGSMLVTPDGRLAEIIRTNYQTVGKTMIFEADRNDPQSPFKPYKIIDSDFHTTKFSVRRDPASGRYYSVANRFTSAKLSNMRNLQCLMVSDDLENWRCARVLHDMSGRDPRFVGLQYADWEFDGDDIICLTRTAINGAHSYHDANCVTYSVIKDFRK